MYAVQKSAASYASKVKLWLAFCDTLGTDPLGATSADVLRYLCLFQNGDSAGGYLTAIRWLYMHNHVRPLWDDTWCRSLYAQRIAGIKKTFQPARKQSPGIMRDLQSELSRVAWADGSPDESLAYCLGREFGFRMQSECFPLQFSGLPGGHSSVKLRPAAGLSRSALEVALASRKNAPDGAIMVRFCTCPAGTGAQATGRSVWTCPVHLFILWSQRRGSQFGSLFRFSETSFVRNLRSRILRCPAALQPPDVSTVTLRAFRRGMAQQLARDKQPLSVILRAGGWRSGAFALYLDMGLLESEAVLDLCAAEDEAEDAPPRPTRGRKRVADLPPGEDIRRWCQGAAP